MPASGVNLLDANVWLAVAVATHQQHLAAKAWFDRQSDDSCAFCRITQMALLRHLTNSTIMKRTVQFQSQAWVTYDRLATDARVIFCAEPPEIELHWKDWTMDESPSHRSWTDRYLAAFAVAGGLRFVTFDQDFKALAPTRRMSGERVDLDLFLIQ